LPRRWASQGTTNGSGKNGEGNDEEQTHTNGPAADVVAAAKRISELEEEVKKLKQEVLYCLADQENTRRIAKRDVADAKAYGVKEFAKSLMDVADTMHKAIESMAGYKSADQKVLTFYEGVKATDVNMLRAFKSNGVESYGNQGDKFDPNKHEALAKVPDPIHPPNTVYQVLRRGWLLNGRVLRPAQVVTTVAPPDVEPAFLERDLKDKVDEADEQEILKRKV